MTMGRGELKGEIMKKSIIAAVIATTFTLPAYALAQSSPRIDKRQENEENRIKDGIDSGQVNQKEARRLRKGQEHIQNMEDKARSDGKVTKKEKARIEGAQDEQSKRIYRDRHD
jgi:hypothetical protein